MWLACVKPPPPLPTIWSSSFLVSWRAPMRLNTRFSLLFDIKRSPFSEVAIFSECCGRIVGEIKSAETRNDNQSKYRRRIKFRQAGKLLIQHFVRVVERTSRKVGGK